MQKEREEWRENQKSLDASKLRFLDETSTNCGMTRLYGRAPTNERVNDYVPDVRFERTSLITTLGLDGITAPIMFKGTLNGDLFEYYIRNILVPTVKPDEIILMDSCSVHKVDGVLDAIYEAGASVMFIPRYSPDFSPIELMFSKNKSTLRKLKPRTHDELVNATGLALDAVTPDDIVGWFKHQGYSVNI